MTARVASSRLIGRSAEFAEFAALADAADGRPSLAFVAGESGSEDGLFADEHAAIADPMQTARSDEPSYGDAQLPVRRAVPPSRMPATGAKLGVLAGGVVADDASGMRRPAVRFPA